MKRGCSVLLALAGLCCLSHVWLVGPGSGRAFVVGSSRLRAPATGGMLSKLCLRASGEFEMLVEREAEAVSFALSGRKFMGKKIQARHDGATVVVDGLEGDSFGKVDVQGEMFGEVQGLPTVFYIRKDINETPLAVVFIQSNQIQGVLLVGAGSAMPSSDEVGWARKLADAKMSLDIDGPLVNVGLPKRWMQNLLKASVARQSGESGDGSGSVTVALLVASAVLVAVLLAVTASTPLANES